MRCPCLSSVIVAALMLGSTFGCSRSQQAPAPAAGASGATASDSAVRAPSPAQQAFMDRLTVRHHFDPATGFIVADEVTPLPAVLRDAAPLEAAADAARREGRTLIAFTTADRCAPCQQFKKDALNDPRVVAFLSSGKVLAVHVEVDREGEAAKRVLQSTAIPASHALRPDGSVERLPGMRSADALLAWMQQF